MQVIQSSCTPSYAYALHKANGNATACFKLNLLDGTDEAEMRLFTNNLISAFRVERSPA